MDSGHIISENVGLPPLPQAQGPPWSGVRRKCSRARGVPLGLGRTGHPSTAAGFSRGALPGSAGTAQEPAARTCFTNYCVTNKCQWSRLGRRHLPSRLVNKRMRITFKEKQHSRVLFL